jgi:tetratricopeptide (TPR) repeat protein
LLDLDLTKGNYANARLWFEKSYRTALFTSADIEIKSLYGLAQVDAAQQLWDDAMKKLENARERAALMQNLYQEIQAWLMQVDILLDRRHYGEAHDLYQKVCARAQPLKSYYRLLAGIEHKMALIYYAKPDYAEAFSHFGRFCSYMARCTEEEFKNSVNETCKYMLVLEAKEIAVLFNRFKQYYMEQLAGYIARDERKVAFFQKKLGELQDLVDLYSI